MDSGKAFARNVMRDVMRFGFDGRSSRTAYFAAWGIYGLAALVLTLIEEWLYGIEIGETTYNVCQTVLGVAFFASLLMIWMVTVRRLHDVSRSGFWVLVLIFPIIGNVLMIVLGLVSPTPFANMYGPVPYSHENLRDMGDETVLVLERLADLHRRGVLTDEEFEIQKRKVLNI